MDVCYMSNVCHMSNVCYEQREHEQRFQKVKERRMRAKDAVAEVDELERQINRNKKGGASSSGTSSMATSGAGTPIIFCFTDEDIEAAREYKG